MNKKQPSSQRPTNSEFIILRALWDLGPSSVRAVYNHLNKQQEMGYTTVLKLMQIMIEKGLLSKDSSQRPQIFQPVENKEVTQKNLVKDLAFRAFGGSAGTLALQALSMHAMSKSELQEIKNMLKEIEDQQS